MDISFYLGNLLMVYECINVTVIRQYNIKIKTVILLEQNLFLLTWLNIFKLMEARVWYRVICDNIFCYNIKETKRLSGL